MHELSVAQNIFDIVRQCVPPGQAKDVRAVRVRVGSLSGIVADSLTFCFGAIVAESEWSRARLDIESVPTVCQCRQCHTRFEPEALIFSCPSCGGGRVELLSGSDLQVVHVELDGEPPPARAPGRDAPRQSQRQRARRRGGEVPPRTQ